tara:strand:+ start:1425 stop:2714 length:1290 start_codon:yes stop_codon:yes gene_type:complete
MSLEVALNHATMALVVKSGGQWIKSNLVNHWKWISGGDIEIDSRIFIGDKVGRMYILLARAAVLSVLVWNANPILTKIKDLKTYIMEVLATNIALYEKALEPNLGKETGEIAMEASRKADLSEYSMERKFGAATMLSFNTFLQNSWRLFNNMVTYTLSMADRYAAILTSLPMIPVSLMRGEGLPILGTIVDSFATIVETITVGGAEMASSGKAALLGGGAFKVLLSYIGTFERTTVAALATTAEYIRYKGQPKITPINLKMLVAVARRNPTKNIMSFRDKHSFVTGENDDDIQRSISAQLNDEVSNKNFWKRFITGESELGAAIKEAKLVFQDDNVTVEMLDQGDQCSQNSQGEQKEDGEKCLTKVTKGVRRRSTSRSTKQCKGMTKKDKPCRRRVTDGEYCKLHTAQDVSRSIGTKKEQLANKTHLVF